MKFEDGVMFTGLIEELGRVQMLAGSGESYRLGIGAKNILDGLEKLTEAENDCPG